jgi:hypothetical protein
MNLKLSSCGVFKSPRLFKIIIVVTTESTDSTVEIAQAVKYYGEYTQCLTGL